MAPTEPSQPAPWFEQLPCVLAVPLRRFEAEEHPVIKLWCVCDTAEMLLRLVAGVAAADLDASGGLPDDLAREVAARIVRPSMGVWLDIALRLVNATRELPKERRLVPELAEAFPRLRERLNRLVELRNVLAHSACYRPPDGEVSRQRADLYGLLRELPWLHELRLLAFDGDVPIQLSGSASVWGPGPELDLTVPPGARAGAVYVSRGDRPLRELWPLQAYATPQARTTTRQHGSARPSEPVPQVYMRCTNKRLDLTALDGDIPIAVLRGAAYDRFREVFGLDRATAPGADAGFVDELAREADGIVGRVREVETIINAVRQHGVLWVEGKAGRGKSALAAKVATDLGRNLARRTVIPWRFRRGDLRCDLARFVEHALAVLSSPGTSSKSSVTFRSAEERLREVVADTSDDVVFVIDGLDELPSVAPLISKTSSDAIWVCFSRPDPDLRRDLDEPVAFREVFPNHGLPPLSREDVSAWLKASLTSGPRDALVRMEAEAGGVARWVDAVVERSEGLAAYIDLVIDDLRSGALQVGEDAATLPPRLQGYFDDLASRVGGTDVGALVPFVLAGLALAELDPTTETLAEVLRHARVLHDETRDRHDELCDEALEGLGALVEFAHASQTVRLYHEELREHLRAASGLANARAVASDGWRSVCRDPGAAASSAVRGHAWRVAVRQLIALGSRSDAIALVTSFAPLMSRLATEGKGVIRDLLLDLGRLEASGASDDLAPWAAFLRAISHEVDEHGPTALLQAAFCAERGSPIHDGADTWLKAHGFSGCWLRQERGPAPPWVGLWLVGHTATVTAVVALDGSPRAISISEDRSARLWDLESGACLRVCELPDDVLPWGIDRVELLGGGRARLMNRDYGTAPPPEPSGPEDAFQQLWREMLRPVSRIWDYEADTLHDDPDPPRPQSRHRPAARQANGDTWSLPGDRVIRTFGDGRMVLVDTAALNSGTSTGPFTPRGERALVLRGGRRALVAASGGQVALWDLVDGTSEVLVPPSDDVVTAMVELDGARVALGSDRGRLQLLDLDTRRGTGWVDGLGTKVVAIAQPDGYPEIVTLGEGGDVIGWDDTLKPELWFDPPDDGAAVTAIAALGDAMVHADAKGRVGFCDPTDVASRLPGSAEWPVTVLRAIDPSRLLSGGKDWLVRCWRAGEREPVWVFHDPEAEVKEDVDDISVLDDRERARVVYCDGALRLVDLTHGGVLWRPDVEPSPKPALSFDPTGRWLAVADGRGVRVWDTRAVAAPPVATWSAWWLGRPLVCSWVEPARLGLVTSRGDTVLLTVEGLPGASV